MLKYEDIKTLGQTYNTLMLIDTKGDNTIYMAECLKTLKSLYEVFSREYSVQQQDKENNTETVEIEENLS